MRLFGLIGYPLGHSFSKGYFSEKFSHEKIQNAAYELFPLGSIQELPQLLLQNPQLKGLNVTIPYKEQVIPFLDQLHSSAQEVGAVNVIKFEEGKLVGYNSDVYGFRISLQEWLGAECSQLQALVLGTGGAAKAVTAALRTLQIPYKLVSRQAGPANLSYLQLQDQPEWLQEYQLIINTTPLGTYPETEACPAIPYQLLTSAHRLYDLVYNPAETLFMRMGIDQGAQTKNGLQMLQLQAEKAWQIWNS